MKVFIVEDEKPAADKLEKYLSKYDPAIEVLQKAPSIQHAVGWLTSTNVYPDLLFMDIQLLDGLSFEIFKQVKVEKPVIFLTAYSQYALDAFHANGIDYLLKPLSYQALEQSMQKVASFRRSLHQASESQLNILQQALGLFQQKSYKTRFMVKLGEHIRSITTNQIGLFYAEGRDVYLLTKEGSKFIIDYKLEELEENLDPTYFFRLNRTFILHIDAIKDVLVYSNSRLKIILQHKFYKEIIVSRDKVQHFKNWFNGQI